MHKPTKPKSLKSIVQQFRSLPLRAKLLFGNLIIVFFTVATMGYYVFYRSQATNKFLVEQFDVTVGREIENRLNGIVSQEASDIGSFFSSMKNVVNIFGTTTGAFISDEGNVDPATSSWNAYEKLTRLPNGSWDNANNEMASIYLPAKSVISNNLAREMGALKGLDFFTQELMTNNPDIIAIYFGSKLGETVYYPNIDLASVLPPDFDVTSRPWYVNASDLARDNKQVVWSEPYQDAALNGLVITSSTPVFDDIGRFRGVVGADIQLTAITEHVANLAVGETGYGFLIDDKGQVVAIPPKGYQDFSLTPEEIENGSIESRSLLNRVPIELFEVLAKMTSGQSGVKLVNINGVNRYIAYKPIPVVGYSLGVVVSEDELLKNFVTTNTVLEEETRRTIFNAAGVIVFLLAVAGLASYGIGNSITAPLASLTKVAEEVASGNLDLRAEVTTDDEVGLLGNTLNSVTTTAQGLIADLERRVAERTRAIERRAAQIQAVAEIGKSVAAQRNLEELLNRATHLISNRFNYYHVGIFLLDPRGEYAVLRAANSSGGAKMLAREHKLRVGREGIVGTAASTGEARIALDVGADAVYFDNPDLPETHSEIALPLIAGEEILGVLDVQSMAEQAFADEDIPALQILADQLAIAVQNARLFRDTQEALTSARRAYGDISQRGWQTLLQRIKAPGYIGLSQGEVTKATKALDVSTKNALLRGQFMLSKDKKSISVPVMSRGQTVGLMRLDKPSHAEPWKNEEIEDIEQLASQVGNALESARLYEEAQRRADTERMTSEIADAIRSSNNIESILQSTIRELGQKLGATRSFIQLDVPSTGNNGSDKSSKE